MNDRYLFKAKSVDNGEWVVGQYVNTCYPQNNNGTRHFIVVYPNEYREIYTSTLCQCTGLKDKNGNLICLEELKEIRGCISEIGKFIGKEKAKSYKQGYNEGIDAAKGQQWISVADRLPDDDTTVLCLVSNHYMALESFYALGCYYEERWHIASNETLARLTDTLFDVFYWVPLPGKPQTDK